MQQTPIATTHIHHPGLTVPDVHAARDFFVDALGFEQVAERPAYPGLFVSNGHVMLTLWQAEDPHHAQPFDRCNNIGLHHFALRVEDGDSLAALHGQLAARDDVNIEFAPATIGGGPTRHMMCRIPGNLRVEFTAPAG